MSPVDSTKRENTIREINHRFRRRSMISLGAAVLTGLSALTLKDEMRTPPDTPLVQLYLEAHRVQDDLNNLGYRLSNHELKVQSGVNSLTNAKIPPEDSRLNLLVHSLHANHTSFHAQFQASQNDLRSSQADIGAIIDSLADQPEIQNFRAYRSHKGVLSSWAAALGVFSLLIAYGGIGYAHLRREAECDRVNLYVRPSTSSI
ncbi:MAG TPA: hypothetical protein VJH37_03700 [Candidatus Nanoarchaeia archaeon]|nr:hypothetical protein [Candidatus Nanoarchaeia archaeon]